jgi:vacuolar-type H+-ATPase subunit I/STV1
LEGIYEELSSFAARLEAAESAINRGSQSQSIAEAGDQHEDKLTNDYGSATSSQQFFETEELQGQVDELRNSADEQLEEMREHLNDLEGRLQDLQLDQDVRQEASHVGEQVFRLAMRMQRLESNGAGNIVSIEEMRELHAELGDLSEQLFHLAGRLTHAERGLSSMAEGFDRICEELAHLRSEQAVESGAEQEAELQASCESLEKDADPTSLPLHHKVREMERSHDTMAEVVWQLKKEV